MEPKLFKIQTGVYPVAVSKGLLKILEQEILSAEVTTEDGVTLNFKDPRYSRKDGGYHPVETMISPDGKILYITDFAYVGSPSHEELAKELDFDFGLGLFGHMGRDFPIIQGRGLFRIWQSNFCSYYQSGVFQVIVGPC